MSMGLSNIMLDPDYTKPPITASVELQVPLTPLMAYDCRSDGHTILVREAAMDGIPLTDGNIILDYHVPEGVVWEDIKYRTNMGSLFITIPIVYPHFYTVQSINERGVLV
jgi:hypothetical protein